MSRTNALGRSQTGLPMKKGRWGTMNHGFKRHGTTNLFAALNVLDGTVIADTMGRHRPQDRPRLRTNRWIPPSLKGEAQK